MGKTRSKPKGWRDDRVRHGLAAKGIPTGRKKPSVKGALGGDYLLWTRAGRIGQYPGHSTKQYVQKLSDELEDENYHTENLYLQAALAKWSDFPLRKEFMARFKIVADDALKGKRHDREDVEWLVRELNRSQDYNTLTQPLWKERINR